MNRKALFVYLAITITLTGCSGKLVIYDSNENEIKGVPFRTAEVYVKTGQFSKLSGGGDCTVANFAETLTLPTGKQYFASVNNAPFAKTAFHIKYADSGAVSEIGLDSEPAVAETLKATSELIKTLVPSLAVASGGGAGGGAAPVQKFCDAGAVGVKFIRFEDFIQSQPK